MPGGGSGPPAFEHRAARDYWSNSWSAGSPSLIAFDVPGSAATPFLGRSVALSGGPATLAFRTGTKVLPVLPERHGTRIDLRMFKPLDPADYRDLPSLRAAIARVFEQLVLAKPEIVEFGWYPSRW